MTMRRNGLTDITTAGSSVSSVNKITICVGVLSVRPPFGLAEPNTGISLAGAARAAAAKNKNRKMERSLIIGWSGVISRNAALERLAHRAACRRRERWRLKPSGPRRAPDAKRAGRSAERAPILPSAAHCRRAAHLLEKMPGLASW